MKYKGVEINNISIFSTPAIYCELLLLTIKDLLNNTVHFAGKRIIPIATLIVSWLLIAYLPLLQVFMLGSRLFRISSISGPIGCYLEWLLPSA